MRIQRMTEILALSLTVTLLVGCSEALQPDRTDTVRGKQQAVTVVPQFSMQNTDQLTDQVRFDEVEFSIAEVRITPSDVEEATPFAAGNTGSVSLDVDGGELSADAGQFELPDPGTYDIRFLLEPKSDGHSITLSGKVSSGEEESQSSEESPSGTSDGRPIPFPADPKWIGDDDDDDDGTTDPDNWVAFAYHTDQTLVVHAPDVRLSPGSQNVSVSFDASSWKEKFIRAVEVSEDDQMDSGTESEGDVVEISGSLDEFGVAPLGMLNQPHVRTFRPRTGMTYQLGY